MNAILKTIMSLPIAATLTGCCNNNEKAVCGIEPAGMVPCIESGYELGVSACYAATTDNALLIAGGCNFPTTPAAEGGSKRYYKGIYRTGTAHSFEWEKVGELPIASAYGVNLQNGNKWYIIGGINNISALDDVLCIDKRTLSIDTLPSLPHAIDNAAGAVYDGKLYIIGGNLDGKASNRLFVLDTEETVQGWQELTPMPSPGRVQPVAAATNKALYVWGGFTPMGCDNGPAVYTDGAKYIFSTAKWEMLGNIEADGKRITLSGGIATATDDSTIIAAGGVDKDIFLDAISGSYKLVEKQEYMYKPAEWYRFNSNLLKYDTSTGQWQVAITDNKFSRAGAQLVEQGEHLYYIGGELKPGIRTPEIHKITID